MIKLTNLKFEPKGRHDSTLAYVVTDTVTSADGSRAYVAVRDVPAGIVLTDASYWVNILDLSAVLDETDAAVSRLNGVIADAESAADAANSAADAGIRTDTVQNLCAQQTDTAQENIGLKKIVKGLTDGFTASGNPVQCNPVGGLAFDKVETHFTPKQIGSGEPSPENIRPFSGYDVLGLTRCGKNLMRRTVSDSVIATNGVIIIPNSDGTYTINGTATGDIIYDMFYCDGMNGALRPGQKYTISFGSEYAAVGEGANMVVGCAVNSVAKYPVFTHSAESRTFTMPDDFDFFEIRIRIYAGAVFNNVTVYPSIEIGERFTGYESYQYDTYTVQLDQTRYSGKMNWLAGELTAEWGSVILDGAEEGWMCSGVGNFYSYNAFPIMISTDSYCSHYKYSGSADKAFVIYVNDTIYFRDSAFETVDNWKAYLAAQYAAGTPVQIAYKLAEPFTIQLIPQVIQALQGANTLYGDGDSIIVEGRQSKTIALESRIAALEAAALNA